MTNKFNNQGYNWGPISLDNEEYDDYLDKNKKEEDLLEANLKTDDLLKRYYEKQKEQTNELQ